MPSPTFIAYFDLLAVGDAGRSQDENAYSGILTNFRTALCEAVADELKADEGDVVYAYSDCAFVESADVGRLGSFLSKLQHELWLKPVFFKGAITTGALDPVPFGGVPGVSLKRSKKLESTIKGHWFGRRAVVPAEAEKALRGIAIQVCAFEQSTPVTKRWISSHTHYTAYYSSESSRRPTVIRDLKIPKGHLPALDGILKTYLLECQASRRTGRYYVPLIVSWIKSHDFSSLRPTAGKRDWEQPLPAPLRHLIQNKFIRGEVARHVGAELIFYALLDKVERECGSTTIKEGVYQCIGESSRLVSAHELVPSEICSAEYRRNVLEKRVHKLFRST